MTFITKYPNTFMAEHLGTTFILELARKGCRKIVASAMPTNAPGGDVLIPFNKVPLAIRRAARQHLGVTK